MKHGKFVMGLVFIALAALFFTACLNNGEKSKPTTGKTPDSPAVPVPVPKPEIIFGMAPGSLVNYLAEIDSHADKFIELLNKIQADGRELSEDDWNEWMGKTYLRSPKKLNWNGRTFEGITEIIAALNSVIAVSKSFKLKKKRINLRFIPFDLSPDSDWMKINRDKLPGMEIDFIGHIKTTIAYNGEFDIEGDMPHRRTCEPDY